jgi:lipopolysaccharide heptosyltransferase I
MHILIVKLSSFGDLLHTLPAVSAIRRNLPDVEISWVVEQDRAEIIRGCPLIDNLIEIDTRSMRGGKVIEEIMLDVGRQAKAVRQFKYDMAIDFQGLLKSALISKISGARQRWGFSKSGLREPASRFLLTNTVETPDQTHIIRKNLNLAATALGFTFDDSDIKFPIVTQPDHVAEADAIVERSGTKFAVLNPGGGWVTKLWHAEKFGQLADRLWEELGLTSVVTTIPSEMGLAERALGASRSGKLIVTQQSLKGYFELLKRATVYVGGDTGPTHLAIAAGTPLVGLFGPTEWWRSGSLDPDDLVVERNEIDCRVDCNRRTCSKWICMDSDVETVFAAVRKRLASDNN